MEVYLLDESNMVKEEVIMIKPKYYKDLLKLIKNKLKNISECYEIFIIDENNKEIIINNDNIYNKIKDILFIREINKDINKLSESKQEILDNKYNCILCSIIIKNENPYYCYKCQKKYHEKCLKEWDKKCKNENKILSCPNCRNELSIEKWNKKLDYENNRKDEANIMNEINENKVNNDIINTIKDKKIKKYETYINKTFNIFKNILNKINEINKVLKLNNNILNNIINNFQLNYENLEIENITNIFNDEFEKIKNYIKFKEKNKLIKNKENKKLKEINNNEDNNKYNNNINEVNNNKY